MNGVSGRMGVAARMFRRSPGLAVTAILTLGIGIAAPSVMFSLATGILGEPPFDQPHELVEIEQNDLPGARTGIGTTARDLDVLRGARRSFEGLEAVRRHVFQVGGGGPRPARIRGAMISAGAFELLGVVPVLGRGLTEADARPGSAGVVILGHEVWEERYDLDRQVIGSILRVDGEPRTVIGVMPDGFEFPRSELLWTPLVADPDGEAIRASVFGRLRDGVSPDAAQSELDVIATNMAAEFPETHRDITISVHPFAHAELGDGEAALMLYSMTLILSFVLVVACVNVSHLLLARAIDRNREMALRMALGASRARVLGIVLSESLLLSAAGGVAGVALTYGSVAWLDSRLGAVISLFWASIEVDIAVLAFAAILVVLSALLGGLLPARLASSVDLIDAIKERSSTASGLRASRTTRALVSVQIAFSCGLLILSGLMVKGVVGLATRELAFEPDGVVTGRVELREFDYPTAEHRLAFVDDLQRGLVGPQIEGVAFASGLPGLGPTLRRFALESEDAGPPREAGVLVVSPAFFSTFRTELVSGRLLSQAEDERRSARTALVTDVFAAQFLGDGSVLGRRFRFDDETGGDMVDDTWIQIVGVVRDGGVFAEGELARPGVFLALAQEAPASLSVSLRTSDVSSAAALLRSTVAARDADLPLYEVSTLRDALHQASTVQRTFGDMFGVFGLIALLMAVVGLYAMVAYGVKRRTHEVGMRRALGASQANIVRLLLRSAAIPLVAGLAAGVAIASIIAPALGAALFGVSPRDPLVYVVVVSVLFAAALFAALLPSIEAARVHPMRALRAD